MATLWDLVTDDDLPGLELVSTPRADSETGVPAWLVHVLTNVLKFPRDEMDRITPSQATDIWNAYLRHPSS